MTLDSVLKKHYAEAPKCSVADPDPGFGTFLTPGSGIRIWDRFFLDPGLTLTSER